MPTAKKTRTAAAIHASYGRLFIVGFREGVNLHTISNRKDLLDALVHELHLRPGETFLFFNKKRTQLRLLTLLDSTPALPLVQLVPSCCVAKYTNHAAVLEQLVQCVDVRTKQDEMKFIRGLAKRARDARIFAEKRTAEQEQTLRIIRGDL